MSGSSNVSPESGSGREWQCGWTSLLPPRGARPALTGRQQADWVVIGAGYTGLATARALALAWPQQRILLLEARRAGEGASARNSGYLVDSTLNDGHLSDTGLQAYLQKYQLNRLAVETVERLVADLGIDCDWDACGKYHATASAANLPRLQRFSQILSELQLGHRLLDAAELRSRLGTHHYQAAVYTEGGVLLQPAALARGMIEALPANVELYEHTRVRGWQRVRSEQGPRWRVDCGDAQVVAPGLILAVNGYMPGLGVKRDRVFPLLLTASLTRPLTDTEYGELGAPAPWGVLSARPMGATVRLTGDRRLMIRNTAEVQPRLSFAASALAARRSVHAAGLARRFPFLPGNLIEFTWDGVTCISGNNANVFERLDEGLFAAGCYNGGGIGLATLFGEQMAIWAAGGSSREIELIQARPRPTRLPPQPLLNMGVRLRLARDRLLARREV